MEKLLQLARKIAAGLGSKEALAVLGLILFVRGVAMLSHAAAFMVAGFLLFAYAYLTATRTAPPSNDGRGGN